MGLLGFNWTESPDFPLLLSGTGLWTIPVYQDKYWSTTLKYGNWAATKIKSQTHPDEQLRHDHISQLAGSMQGSAGW